MATISVILYTSKVLKDGSHPIMIRVTENRKSQYISLGFNSLLEHWDLTKQRPNRKHPNKMELDLLIGKRLQDLGRLVMEGEINNERISPETILDEVRGRRKIVSLVEFSLNYCQQLKEEGRLRTAEVYKRSILRMLKVLNRTDITFQDLNVSMLNKFQSELLKKGGSENGISVYMRAIRTLYYRGISEGVARNLNNPFKIYKISKLDNRTIKRAITKDQMKQIATLELEPGSKVEFARDVFMFSYYCRGMNFRDIALLKKQNLQDGRLQYIRSKTGQHFSIKLLDPAVEILDRMKLVPNTGNYLFPILTDFHNTPQRVINRLTKIIRQVNEGLKEIAVRLDINIPLTTYVARHTYATVLKRSGVSTSIISEGMGHATEAITQTYLASFGNDVIDEADKFLL